MFKNRYFLLDGTNLTTSSRCKVQVWQATLSATASADLMSSDYFTGQLDGTLVTPSGKSSPYEVEMRLSSGRPGTGAAISYYPISRGQHVRTTSTKD
ncbi:hypothetical protein [Gallaecimonas sp. GXIMD1310]|uniref:hypothetical protein n=1 Tax=Gallaecimonas sp. GXIMD1310 TaxID=3131926 RepID=UPI0032509E63